MLRDLGSPKETASETAKRKWKNNATRLRIIEERNRPRLKAVDEEPEIADIIENDEPRYSPIERIQSKFKKEIKQMLECHIDKNILHYVASLRHTKKRLLREKLRRLEARQRDLFGPAGG
jgi:hypothetical protein